MYEDTVMWLTQDDTGYQHIKWLDKCRQGRCDCSKRDPITSMTCAYGWQYAGYKATVHTARYPDSNTVTIVTAENRNVGHFRDNPLTKSSEFKRDPKYAPIYRGLILRWNGTPGKT